MEICESYPSSRDLDSTSKEVDETDVRPGGDEGRVTDIDGDGNSSSLSSPPSDRHLMHRQRARSESITMRRPYSDVPPSLVSYDVFDPPSLSQYDFYFYFYFQLILQFACNCTFIL